ncbi:unnamed protein product [Brachionus calyciflorus]|uniref:Uncharacterized protein n=1 Tax=Brachionus calyciflorus TaxID=104777 RepID=A0A813SN17_9BILA|nr:unnamed protein product [Brachionus calyciflorus]
MIFTLISLSLLLPSYINANLLIATATNDKLFLLNSTSITKEISTKVSHLEFISSKYLASSFEKKINIWNLSTLTVDLELNLHASKILDLKSLSENNFISADESANFFRWINLSFSSVLDFSSSLNKEKLIFLKIHNNKIAAGYTGLNDVLAYNIQTNELIFSRNKSDFQINALDFLSETQIVLSYQNGVVLLLDILTRLTKKAFISESPLSLMFSSNLLLGTSDGILYEFDSDLKQITRLPTVKRPIKAIEYVNSSMILTITEVCIRFWNVSAKPWSFAMNCNFLDLTTITHSKFQQSKY